MLLGSGPAAARRLVLGPPGVEVARAEEPHHSRVGGRQQVLAAPAVLAGLAVLVVPVVLVVLVVLAGLAGLAGLVVAPAAVQVHAPGTAHTPGLRRRR